MPGNNVIELCPVALCQAVAIRLNGALVGGVGTVRVLSVEAVREGGATVFRFTVTTDPKEPSK